MSRIEKVLAREILDSRGFPTVEVEIELHGGARGRAAVPSGASTGEHEALELRDGDKARYLGKGVRTAVTHVIARIGPAITGRDAVDQAALDALLCDLDGTPGKSHLGANAVLGASLAVARAAARARSLPLWQHLNALYREAAGPVAGEGVTLPVPLVNILNGGRHADNNVDFQEFMVVPWGASSFADSLRMGAEVFHSLKAVLKERRKSTAVGDEGGFAPDFTSNASALEAVAEAIARAGYQGDVGLALDVAASEFYDRGAGVYRLTGEGRDLDAGALVDLYAELCDRRGVLSIEDGMAEDDWDGWCALTARLGAHTQLVGDDLFVTNPRRLARGIELNAANAILVKVNQIGTLSETFQAIAAARRAGFGVVISHRSGETEDTFIADLAVATDAGQIKTGSTSRGERTCKYNRLLRIEEALGGAARFAGRSAMSRSA